MGSTASTIYIHKNEHLKHVSWTIFEMKTIWMGPKVIWGLSDTLSDLDKLNQGEYSKYQLCSGEPRSPDPGLSTGKAPDSLTSKNGIDLYIYIREPLKNATLKNFKDPSGWTPLDLRYNHSQVQNGMR